MSIDTVVGLVEALRTLELLPASQFDELLRSLRPRFKDPQALVRELLQRGWLTPYQVNQLFQGHGKNLVLGAYVLLERLGEGGMGEVYKARHKRLERTVALKLIRKQLVANPDLITRFRKEIEAAARLSHPNIVLAYDADEIDGVHFYTMEFVEGTVLSHLVKRSGPMSLSLACEYTRQAAAGLQHAHERGIIHRDIKPSNLILSWTSKPADPAGASTVEQQNRALWGSHMPLVKIFDMGLARGNVADNAAAFDGSITEKNALMGTPDFISPEQAVNAHKADIRSDLYSLGATLYYLVTGKVPFPGGGTLEKIIRHRMDEPRPLAKLRPGVPAELQAVVSKLMAKPPEMRYQTPAELVQTLHVYLTQLDRRKE